MPIWGPGRHIPTQKIPKCPPPPGLFLGVSDIEGRLRYPYSFDRENYGALLVPYTRTYSIILGMYSCFFMANTFLPLARLFFSGATFFSLARLFFTGATFFRGRDFFFTGATFSHRHDFFFAGATFFRRRDFSGAHL